MYTIFEKTAILLIKFMSHMNRFDLYVSQFVGHSENKHVKWCLLSFQDSVYFNFIFLDPILFLSFSYITFIPVLTYFFCCCCFEIKEYISVNWNFQKQQLCWSFYKTYWPVWISWIVQARHPSNHFVVFYYNLKYGVIISNTNTGFWKFLHIIIIKN